MEFRCAKTGSKGNSYALIADNGEVLLIECGVKWSETMKMIDYQTSKVVGCIASHAHLDHLRSYKECLRYGIPIYTNDEAAEHFEIISGERMIGLPERIPKSIGSWVVIPFYIPHTSRDKETGTLIPCPNFGYLVEHNEMGKLLYMTDMEYSPFSFKSQRINHLIIEANYCDDLVDNADANYRHRIQGHCSLDTCKGIVLANKTPDLRTVTLIHLSDSAADPDRMKQEIQEVAGKWVRVEISYAGMNVELSKYPWG